MYMKMVHYCLRVLRQNSWRSNVHPCHVWRELASANKRSAVRPTNLRFSGKIDENTSLWYSLKMHWICKQNAFFCTESEKICNFVGGLTFLFFRQWRKFDNFCLSLKSSLAYGHHDWSNLEMGSKPYVTLQRFIRSRGPQLDSGLGRVFSTKTYCKKT